MFSEAQYRAGKSFACVRGGFRRKKVSGMHTGLKDRVAIVAASSQGIGKACAEALAAEGANVALCARNEKPLSATAEEIRSRFGVKVFTQTLDVTDASAVQRFVADVANALGGIDVCV